MFATIGQLGRLARAGLTLARYDALSPTEYQDRLPPLARVFGRVMRLFAKPDRSGRAGERLARALEKLGPAYVKLGQFLATRGDILGQDFVDGLSTLKDRLPAFPDAQAREALAREFGQAPEHLFASLDPAVAAASVAQVHRAVTTEGANVAVKILRPGVEARIAKDVDAFRLAARLAQRFAPAARRLEPVKLVETLARSLALEMDLRLEGAAAGELDDIAGAMDGFRVPRVDWARTGRRVLTTEWVDAVPLSDEPALNAAGVDRPALAVTVMRAFLTSALEYGVFHADFHEGNLFADRDGNLVAVDFGIMGRIGPPERRYLAEIIHGFITRDYARIAEVHFEAGYVSSAHGVEEFAGALRAVGEPISGRKASDVSMGRVLLQLFEITDLFDMRLRPELVLLQKTMVQAEGVARRLDPDHDIWAASAPVVERFLRRALGPEGMAADAMSDLRRLRAVIRRLPGALDDLNTAAEAVAEGGFHLDDDTVGRLAKAQAQATRGRGLAVWIIALSGAALAAAGLAAALG